MSYRRNSEGQREWRNWLDQNRDTLIKCGLPEFVLSDRLTWLRFLESGGWHHQPRWGVGMLSSQQTAMLRQFIEGEFGSEEYRSLLKNLDDLRNVPRTDD